MSATPAETSAVTASRYAMFPAGSPVLVMVSGGADSVALLHLLASGNFGEIPLAVMHVNHMLREGSADEDQAFVESSCATLGVECHVVRYDVGAYAASEGLNLEDAGRRIRYRFAEAEIDAMCARLGMSGECGRIAVAHSLDDRIETFFMRAIAGSGSGGLASIAPVRGRIVRPLLECARDDLRTWLAEQGIAWREDPSNTDTSRTRAFVRAELLPVAQRMNPAFRTSMARTMDLLADDDRLLSDMAAAFARDFTEIEPEVEVAFNRQWMGSLERTMARRTVRAALAQGFPEASRIEAEHVEALVDGLARDDFSHDLPGGLRAHGEYDRMIVSRSDRVSPTVAPALLSLPGTADMGAAGRIIAREADESDTDGSPDSVIIDAGTMTGDLTVDSVRAGDRMRPLGMQGSRKLSDLLIDEKVPKRLRGAVPVVRDGERIVWLAGVRMSDEYRIDATTTRAVRLTWERGHGWQ